jgi:hypothetical protein
MNSSKRFLMLWRVNKMKSCPDCNSSSGLRKIFHGLPDGPVDVEKYAIGGCCVTGDDSTVKCIECGWKGQNVNNAPGLGEEIRMVELQDISKMSDSQIESYARQIWQKLAKPKKGSDDGYSKR